MRRFMQVVLAVNVAIVAFIDLIGYVLQVGPVARVAAAEPILARQYAAVALGYAVVLVVFVLRRFQRDPVWLLVPAIFLGALWFDALFELSAGTGLVSENLPPTILRPLFVACYVTGYVTLRRAARDKGVVAAASGRTTGPAAAR